jgi:hypothetical protein
MPTMEESIFNLSAMVDELIPGFLLGEAVYQPYAA